MSWAVEEWRDGLSGKALQKVQEFESQLDKLKKERQQKQFQVESLEAALQKQKQKFDSEKSEAAALKRENQSLVESCDTLDKTRQKLSHDLHVKEQQVNFLEGQLSASKKQIERLEQELKKYKNELERSHSSSNNDMQLYATPQKTFAAPATPGYRQHDSKLEELQGKYSQEVEERKRLEAELKVLQVKLLNQSSVSHKDIARQQAGSSVFPWQQEQQTPSKRRNAAASSSSMWFGEETPLRPTHQSSTHQSFTNQSSSHQSFSNQSSSHQSFSNQSSSHQSSFMSQGDTPANSQQADQLRSLNQDLKIKVAELEDRLQTQDKDIKSQMNKFIETQSLLDKARKDFAEKERSLTKLQDDFTKMTSQHEQAQAKGTSLEQKLKQVTEEMNCQRHNSDSTRRALEQKLKDQEKEAQKELAHVQSTHQALDQQFNQTKTKMSQEIQQMKKEANIHQSDIDKMTALKNRLEKDLEEQKQRLFKSEQGLQSSQTKEAELKKKCDEMQREHNNLSSQLQQATKRLSQLEEDRSSNEKSLKQSRNMVDDLKAKTEAQTEELKSLNKKLECQSQASAQDVDNLKKTLSALEAKENLCQEELKKQKQQVEQLQNQIQTLQKEKHDAQLSFEAKQKEVEQIKQEYEKIVEWKNEKAQLIENTESDRNAMQSKIDELEKNSVAQTCLQEKLQEQNKEKQSQIDSLKGELLNKCMELEEKGRMYDEMLEKYNDANQKHAKDAENTLAQMKALQDEVSRLETRLQVETNKIGRMEQSHSELLVQLEGACDLAKSKDAIIELHQSEISDLQETVSQSSAQQEQLLAKLEEEKSSLVKDYEESMTIKATEAEEAKLNLMKCEQDTLLLKDQVTSLDSAVTLQKGLNAKLQTRNADLLQNNEALTQKINEGEKREEELLNEVKALSDQAKSLAGLQDQCTEFAAAAEQSKLSLETLQGIHNQTVEELQTQKATMEKFEVQISEVEAQLSSLEAEKCSLIENIEKAKREKTDLSSTYTNLLEAHHAVCEEKTDLQNQLSSTSAELTEKTAMLETVKHDLSTSNVLCTELQSHVETLRMQHESLVNLNLNLEKNLEEKAVKIGTLEADISQWSTKFNEAAEAHVAEMEKLQMQHESLVNLNLNLEKNLEEKTDKIGTLEADISQWSTKFNEAAEAHVAEMEKHLQKYKNVKEQLDVLKAQLQEKCQEAEDFEEKMATHTSEISKLKEDLALNNAKLQEVNEAYDRTSQELSSYKQSASSLTQQFDDVSTKLEAYQSRERAEKREIQKLKDQLCEAEQERSKASEALKEKNVNLNKIKVQLEMLQMDLEDNEACITSYDSQVEELKGTVSILEEKLDKTEAERSNLEVALDGVQEQLSTKTSEISQLSECLENTQKKQLDHSALASELQATNENLKVAFDTEVCKRTNIETIYNNLTEQKRKVDEDLQELKKDYQNALEGLDSLKQKNDSLQDVIQNLTTELETLRLALEQARRQTESTSVKNKEFEERHAELSQQLLTLQNEHVLFNEKYSQLLSQVVEQQSLIAQLQENKEEDRAPNTECDLDRPACENLQASTPEPIAPANENQETGLEDLEVSQLVCEESRALAEEKLQAKSKELEELSHAFEEAVRTLEEQQEVQLEQLRVQHNAELSCLQEKMEAKLADERQHTEMLTAQLEVTRQQMEELNLASQSLLLEVEDNIPQTMTEEKSSVSIEKGCTKEEEADDGEFFDAPDSPEESADGALLQSSISCIQGNPEEQNMSPVDLQVRHDTIKQQDEDLQAKYELLTTEMAMRKDLCTDMENKAHEFEKEKSEFHKKMVSKDGLVQALSSQVEMMTEEINSLKLQLQTSNSQLSDVLEMVDSLEHAKGGWDDKFFQLESELKRTRSEKANLEKHILSMEVDLESMQEQKERLETELESIKKAKFSLEQDLNKAVTEGGQLKEELLSCSDEREKEGQTLLKLKEKADLLEKKNIDSKQLIKMLEDDIHTGKQDLEESSNKMDNLVKEKEKLLEQALALEINVATLSQEKEQLLAELVQLRDGDSTVLRESENMVVKIHALRDENVKLSQSLESSLLEKGEIAARLIATQEEVAQMRTGIEKLKVRIESDERKKGKMSQLLKDAQLKSDSLQDSIDKLERERVLSDQSLEEAILQAETAKAELEDLEVEKETLSAKIAEVTNDLNNLREEKDRLERELLQRIEEEKEKLNSHLEELQGLMDEKQQWIEASEQLKAAAAEWEAKAQAESTRNETLQTTTTTLQSNIKQLEKQLETANAMNTELTEKAQTESARNETLQTTTTSLQSNIEQLEKQLETTNAMNTELTDKINAIQESNLNFQSQLENQSRSAGEVLQQTLTSLNVQLEESRREAQNHKLSLETLEAEKQELARKLSDIEKSVVEMKDREVSQEEAQKRAQHLHVEELRAMAVALAAAESKATELLADSSSLRVSEQQLTATLAELRSQHDQSKPAQDELNKKVVKLSKERDGILSKLNLWMKSCKQLEGEKQALVLELQTQEKLVVSLKASQTQAGAGECGDADLQAELVELREALEEKTREADESMDRCCSLMVKVHKLEEANESLQNKMKRLSSSSSKGRRSTTSTSTQPEDTNSRTPGNNLDNSCREEPDGHASVKRTRAQAETPNKAQEALQNLAKRLKAGTPQKGLVEEDFTPEGLPERVMKGFADIPRGEMSPFIVRRTTVQQRCSPRLAAQKSTPAQQQVSSAADTSTHGCKPPAEGSNSQEGLTGGVSGVLAAVTNSPRLRGPESPAVGLEQRKSRRSGTVRRTSDQHSKSLHPANATPAKQDENCHVQ
ncbi:centromere protein F isoform X2 [Engraulis encrasicolus]|uniref:centromere protein F isoform X2 n=1 Tax=Engraulis encrasicolus TaxID=184585 RepID=UPI002FD1967C